MRVPLLFSNTKNLAVMSGSHGPTSGDGVGKLTGEAVKTRVDLVNEHPSEEVPLIRPATPEDSRAVVDLVVAAEMFPADDVGLVEGMLADYFGTNKGEDHACLIDDEGDGPLGVAYYQPKAAADRVWDLTMIAVRPEHQGKGRGAAMLSRVEEDLRSRGQRLLLVETSGLPQYDRTRAFYLKCGYEQEARVRDYWEAGDDLVLFRMALNAA